MIEAIAAVERSTRLPDQLAGALTPACRSTTSVAPGWFPGHDPGPAVDRSPDLVEPPSVQATRQLTREAPTESHDGSACGLSQILVMLVW